MQRSKRSQEGELLIDHRNSPGVSSEFLRRVGVDAIAVPGGHTFESATVVCAHCGVMVVLNPDRTRARGYCGRCDHYVCDSPVCNRDCTPLVAAFDVMKNSVERTGSLPERSLLQKLMPSLFGGAR